MKPMLGNLKGVYGQMENFKDRLVNMQGSQQDTSKL